MRDTHITFVCGMRRRGKSDSVKRDIAKASRLLVWDSTEEYGRDLKGIHVVTDRSQLLALLAKHRKSPLRVAFQPRDLKFFDWFCRTAARWGNCVVLVEELASVTSPGKAPKGWGDLIRLSAHYEVDIFAITQRPAEIDKTVLGNAGTTRCFALLRPDDIKYMAKELRLDFAAVDSLIKGWYFERDTDTRKVKMCKLPWAKPWPKGRKQAA